MNVSKTFLSALAACFGLALFVASCATPSTTDHLPRGPDELRRRLHGRDDDAELRRVRKRLRIRRHLSGGRLHVRRGAPRLQRYVRRVQQQQLRHLRGHLFGDDGLQQQRLLHRLRRGRDPVPGRRLPDHHQRRQLRHLRQHLFGRHDLPERRLRLPDRRPDAVRWHLLRQRPDLRELNNVCTTPTGDRRHADGPGGTTGAGGTAGTAGTTGTAGTAARGHSRHDGRGRARRHDGHRGGTTGTAGTTGAGGARTCAIVPPPGAMAADVISDFEEGFGVMIKQGGPHRILVAVQQHRRPPEPDADQAAGCDGGQDRRPPRWRLREQRVRVIGDGAGQLRRVRREVPPEHAAHHVGAGRRVQRQRV